MTEITAFASDVVIDVAVAQAAVEITAPNDSTNISVVAPGEGTTIVAIPSEVTIDLAVAPATVNVDVVGVAVSTDPGNAAILGSDRKIWVAKPEDDPELAKVTRIAMDTPQAIWVLDVGKKIGSVRILDSTGTEVEPGGIDEVGTSVRLTFSAPFSGVAYVTA